MKDKFFDIAPLVLLQRVSWVLFFVLFGISAALGILGLPFARKLADLSVIGLLVVTFSKTILFARQFYRARLRKYYLLSLILALVLLSTIAINYWEP